MASNTAVLELYLGLDSLRQNVQGEIKQSMIKQPNTACEAIWSKKRVNTAYDQKKRPLRAKPIVIKHVWSYGFTGIYRLRVFQDISSQVLDAEGIGSSVPKSFNA